MCKTVEETRELALKESAKETAKNFFLNGISLELVKKSLTLLTEEEITAIYKEVRGRK